MSRIHEYLPETLKDVIEEDINNLQNSIAETVKKINSAQE